MPLNSWSGSGYVGRDPETFTTNTGKKVVKFSVAVDEGYFDSTKNWVDKTAWVDVDTWGYVAEKCEAKVMKGSFVIIEGRLSMQTWEDKQTGAQRSKLFIKANMVDIPKAAQREAMEAEQGSQPQAVEPTPAPAAQDDIPF